MAEEPVEIDLILLQDVDVEGKKATDAIEDIAQQSERAQEKVTVLGSKTSKVGKQFQSSSRGVGDYARQMNRFNFSLQQVARELPNAAISPQLFFMSISNNLPMLQDDLRRIIALNKELKASGQATIPVYKQIAKSIFSWQTALIAGTTLLLVYGKETVAFVGKLLKSEDALSKATKAHEEYKKATREGVKQVQDEIVKLDLLYKAATDVTKSIEERNAAVDELQRMYPKYLGNIDDEVLKTGNAVTAYQNLKNAIIDAAIAKAYQQKITEAQTKIIELEAERAEKVVEFNKQIAKTIDVGKTPGGSKISFGFGVTGASAAQKKIKEIDQEINDLTKQIKRYANGINITDLIFNPKSSKKGKTDKEKAAESLRKISLDIQQQVDAATIAAMQDGAKKRLAIVENEYNQRRDRIAEKLREIEELEKKTGIISVGNRNLLKNLLDASTAEYEAAKEAIEMESRQEVDAVFAEVNEKFNTQLQNQLNQVDAFYAEKLQKLRESNLAEDEFRRLSDELESKRLMERSQVVQEYAIKRLDFEEQIALKEQELANRRVFWETDKQKKLLDIQLEYARKRLKVLDNAKISGADVDNEITETRQLINILSGDIEDAGVNKFAEIADAVAQVTDALSDLVSVWDEDAGTLLDWASQAASIGESLFTGNYLQAAVQAIDLIGGIVSANKEANREIAQFNYDLAQQAIDYSIEVINAIKDIKGETDSIFNEDYNNTLTQSMLGYNEAIAKQRELMDQLGNATIKTGVKKKKFLGITFGTKDVYSDLLKTYPELIEADGRLNKELAQTLVESGRLNQESQDLVENIIATVDAADSAMQQFEDSLSSLVGSLGDDLKRALDEGFASGTDAAEDMVNAIGDYLQQLATSTLFNEIFGEIFADLQKRMEGSYGEGGDFDLRDDLIWFMENYSDEAEAYNKGLEDLQKTLSQYGVDLVGNSSRTASAKGIAQASQDSVDELNGRMTAVQQFTYELRNNSTEALAIDKEVLNHQRMIKGQLDTIAENSGHLKDLPHIKQTLDEIKLKGIKVKT